MKKEVYSYFSKMLLLATFLLLAGLPALADDDWTTIENNTAGKLSEAVGENKNSITKLKVSGEINSEDITLLKTMATDGTLSVLDLSGATAEEGYLDMEAFYGCTKLTNISLPQNVTSIGYWAFYGCIGLTSVTIPNSVESIKTMAFFNCSSLASVTIGSSVASIGTGAFQYCSSLKEVVLLGNTLPNIDGDNAFYGISSGATLYCSIGLGTAFGGDAPWSDFKAIEASVVSLGSDERLPKYITDENKSTITKLRVFGKINSEDITLLKTMASDGTLSVLDLSGATADKVDLIGEDAFSNSKLTSISLPQNVTSIGGWAFQNCSSLKDITIPNSVISIGSTAFGDCTSLTSVTISTSVTSIGSSAFMYCSKLESITIPNSVTSIGGSAFLGCSSLAEVTIGKSVESIGDGAFGGCTGLKSIRVEAQTPPQCGSDCFYECSTDIPLYVPCGTKEAYQAADTWSSFTNIIDHDYNVAIQSSANGSAQIVSYTCDNVLTIQADANEHYYFVRWSDDNTDNPRTLTVTEDMTLTAEFAAIWDYNVYDDCTKNGYEAGIKTAPASVEAVDLGLSIKWATCNVGATNPEDKGNYYAWGETETKTNYSWDTYAHGTSLDNLNKYNANDNLTTLEASDDAAIVNWGGNWRMPTDDEWTELREKCTGAWTDNYNGTGVAGYEVKATNGNSIFLPAAGYRDGDDPYDAGSDGYYWSSSLNADRPYDAWYVDFYSSNVSGRSYSRYYGRSVRPVCTSAATVSYATLTLYADGCESANVIKCNAGQQINVTAVPADEYRHFVRWSDNNTENPRLVTVTENMTLTAEFASDTKEYVDLGLPSGLLWATCNVGAYAPQNNGNYYAWGETETKTNYSWDTYKYGSADNALTKYCSSSDYGEDGFTDDLTTLEANDKDDAAAAHWSDKWRMPTDAEWTELRDNCTWEWTNDYNGTGVAGYEVKSKATDNSNSIFLPAAGSRTDDDLGYAGSGGYYWSSSLYADYPGAAWLVYFYSYSDGVGRDGCRRCYGQSVRPVQDAPKYAVTINTAANGQVTADLTETFAGRTVTLTVKPDAYYELVELKVLDEKENPIEYTAMTGESNKYAFTMPASAVTVSATFKAIDYAINIDTEIQNGAVSVVPADKATANFGDVVTLTVEPAIGYELDVLQVLDADKNPVNVSEEYKFKMPASAVTVSATFKAIDYAINIDTEIQNGAVSVVPADKATANYNEEITLKVEPATGYELDVLTVLDADKKPVIVSEEYKFKMPASAVTVSATFKAIDYAINIDTEIQNGAVSVVPADKATANFGDVVTLTVEPAIGYELDVLQVLDADKNPVNVSEEYKFKMPASAVTVSATFKAIDYAINIDESIANGAVSVVPADKATANYNEEITLKVEPATGYELDVLTVLDADKKPVNVSEEYKFTMPASAVTVSATFKAIDYAINIDPEILNGEIKVASGANTAHFGDVVTLTVTPATGYKLAELLVQMGDDEIEVTDDYTFVMPAGEVTISGIFEEEGTALRTIEMQNLHTEHGRIVCDGDFQIFDLLGRNVTRLNGSLNGVYVVKLGDSAQKVVVR